MRVKQLAPEKGIYGRDGIVDCNNAKSVSLRQHQIAKPSVTDARRPLQ
jgi:hypothetical protein